MPAGSLSPYYYNTSESPAGFGYSTLLYTPRLVSLAGNGWYAYSTLAANPSQPDALPSIFETEIPGINAYGARNHLNARQFQTLTFFDLGDAYFGAGKNALFAQLPSLSGLDNPDISLYDENNNSNVGTTRTQDALIPQEIAVALNPAAQSSRTAAVTYDVIATHDRKQSYAQKGQGAWLPTLDVFGAIYGGAHGFSLTAFEMPELRNSFIAPASCTADEIERYQDEHGGSVPDATTGCAEIKNDANFVGWANDDTTTTAPQNLQLPSNFRGLDYIGYAFMQKDAIHSGWVFAASLDHLAPGVGWAALALPTSSVIAVATHPDATDVTFELNDEGLDYLGAALPALGILNNQIGHFDGQSAPQEFAVDTHATVGTGALLATLSSMSGNRPATDNDTATTTDDVTPNLTNTAFTWIDFAGYGFTSFIGGRSYLKIMHNGTSAEKAMATTTFGLGEAAQLGITTWQVGSGNVEALAPFFGGQILVAAGAFIAPDSHWLDYSLQHVSLASAQPISIPNADAGFAGISRNPTSTFTNAQTPVLAFSVSEGGNGFFERGLTTLLSGSRTAFSE